MNRIKRTIVEWVNIARMSSGELAVMTLPPWVLTALHVRQDIKQDYIGLIAAGVAFYFLLASFPALAAVVSIFGLFSDPYVIMDEVQMMAGFLPRDVMDMIVGQVTTLAGSTSKSLSISLVVSVLITIYSATRGTSALIKGFNIAYDAEEKRGMFKLTFLSYGLTALMLCYFLVSLLLVAGLPVAIKVIEMPPQLAELVQWMRWPMLFGVALIGLEVLYTLGPCRKRRHYGISAGAMGATMLWIVGSSLFSLFVSHFSNFNQTYGSLGAVAVLMTWFWVSALTILIGAEINGTIEKNRAATDETGDKAEALVPSSATPQGAA